MNLDWSKNRKFVRKPPMNTEKENKRAGIVVCKESFHCFTCKKKINVGEMYWASHTCDGLKERCLSCRKKAFDSI